MHTTPRTLVVHDVELLVQEGEETYLSILQALVEVLEDLLVHVVHSVLSILTEAEEVTQLLLRLGIRVKIHVQLLL